MRTLLVSHTSQLLAEGGHARAEGLSKLPGLDLCVLIPDRWRHYGKWLRSADARSYPFHVEIGDVAWPWAGPAQSYLHWYPRLAKLLADFRPDVVDIWEEPWSLVSAHACWEVGRHLPRTRIVSETEQNISKTLPFPFETFRSYTLRNIDMAIGRSRDAVSVLRSKGFDGPTTVIPNGVDKTRFRPIDRQQCRAKLQLSGFVVGYVGRFVDEKGIFDLLDALCLCAVSVNLALVGSGPLCEAIKKRSAELGLGARVRLLPPQSHDQLPEFMNAIDVLALPSRTTSRWKEQFGRVIIEAHACATPVIGSNSGAIPEVVGSGGLIFREGHPADIADTINKLAVNSLRRSELGAAGRRQVDETYSWDRIAERIYDAYSHALGE